MITDNHQYNIVALENKGVRARSFFQLLKFRLTFLVVFSGCFGFLLATEGNVNWGMLLPFIIGSFLVTGAANTLNQIIEKDLDKLMNRTKNRPLPTGKIAVSEAIAYAVILTIIGSLVLTIFVNPLAAALSLLSLILYAFVYTPLKQISSISVFVGAFPGAMPPLIGWAAVTGSISVEALIIFGIQFIWQFPHFWAIAWIGDEDYKRAGFKMLPSNGGQSFNTAFQMMVYSLFLIPIGLLPAQYGITGISSAIIAIVCGLVFLSFSILLMKSGSKKAALSVMFGSFFYLPIIQVSYLLDKI